MDAISLLVGLVVVVLALVACTASLVVRVARMGSTKDVVLVAVAFVAIITGLVGLFGVDTVHAKEDESAGAVVYHHTMYLPIVMVQRGGTAADSGDLVSGDEPVVPTEPVVVPVVPDDEPDCVDCGHNGDHGENTGPAAGPYPHDGCGKSKGPLAAGQDGIAPVPEPVRSDNSKK